MIITPQEGKQFEFISTSADIALYGGSAGGGKTYALLLEASRNIMVRGFGGVIFRRSLKQIEKEGALWDTSSKIFSAIGGRGVKGNLIWYWDKYGSKIDFSYLARDEDVKDWQGTQIPFIGFDELTHFSKVQFFYMLSRSRTDCGVRPYVRATTNPDPDSWVREFIDWYIGDDGVAIEERSGVVRWFINQNDEIFWFDRKIDAIKKFGDKARPKSFTFIRSDIHDNKILMENDPDYLSNLEALQRVDRERLLYGNWDVRAGVGDYFKREDFEIIDAVPPLKHEVRCWDFAGTEPSERNPDPDWTVGQKMGVTASGEFIVTDLVRERMNPSGVEKLLKSVTSQDGKDVLCRMPQDAGSAGKVVAHNYAKMLRGYKVKILPVTGNKEVRATPASAQAGIGNIKLLRGKWNEEYIKEHESFPVHPHDDMVDTTSDCIEELTDWKEPIVVKKRPKILRG